MIDALDQNKQALTLRAHPIVEADPVMTIIATSGWSTAATR